MHFRNLTRLNVYSHTAMLKTHHKKKIVGRASIFILHKFRYMYIDWQKVMHLWQILRIIYYHNFMMSQTCQVHLLVVKFNIHQSWPALVSVVLWAVSKHGNSYLKLTIWWLASKIYHMWPVPSLYALLQCTESASRRSMSLCTVSIHATHIACLSTHAVCCIYCKTFWKKCIILGYVNKHFSMLAY